MSTSAAPSSSSRRAVAAATSGSRLSPPSEKLSGVTLTTPITEGRGQHSASGGRLTRRWRVDGWRATEHEPRRRALIGVAALLLLLIAVAIASTGSVPAGAGGARRPADRIVDVLITLYLLLMVVGLGMWVYIFLVRKDAVARRARHPGPATAVGLDGHPRDRLLVARPVHSLALDDEGLRQRIAAGSTGATPRRPPPGSSAPRDATSPSSRRARRARRRARRRRGRGALPLAPRAPPMLEPLSGVRSCPPSPTSSTRRSTTCGPSRTPAGP